MKSFIIFVCCGIFASSCFVRHKGTPQEYTVPIAGYAIGGVLTSVGGSIMLWGETDISVDRYGNISGPHTGAILGGGITMGIGATIVLITSIYHLVCASNPPTYEHHRPSHVVEEDNPSDKELVCRRKCYAACQESSKSLECMHKCDLGCAYKYGY